MMQNYIFPQLLLIHDFKIHLKKLYTNKSSFSTKTLLANDKSLEAMSLQGGRKIFLAFFRLSKMLNLEIRESKTVSCCTQFVITQDILFFCGFEKEFLLAK